MKEKPILVLIVAILCILGFFTLMCILVLGTDEIGSEIYQISRVAAWMFSFVLIGTGIFLLRAYFRWIPGPKHNI